MTTFVPDAALIAANAITDQVQQLWMAAYQHGAQNGVELAAKFVADYAESVRNDLTIDSVIRDFLSTVMTSVSDQFRLAMLAIEVQ